MISKLLALSIFEIKRKLINEKAWLSSSLLILISISIFPLTLNPIEETLKSLFISVITTSMLLGIVLITLDIFSEDLKDGMIDQYIIFGARMPIIFLSKVIASSIEFILTISIIFPVAAILYSIPLSSIFKIWIIHICSIPLLSSITIFGSLLTMNLNKNTSISILVTFPLLISTLILLSLSSREILAGDISSGLLFLETFIGINFITLPIFCLLSSLLHK